MKECPSCKTVNEPNSSQCDCGYSFEPRASSVSFVAPQPLRSSNLPKILAYGFVIVCVVSMIRVYVGSPLGFRIVFKSSPSFTDTFVNLDDLMGMPNFAFSAQHPAVKRQLQEMGVIETDEQFERRIKDKIDRDFREGMRKTEEEQKRIMREMYGR